jgi:hypothetical protein
MVAEFAPLKTALGLDLKTDGVTQSKPTEVGLKTPIFYSPLART